MLTYSCILVIICVCVYTPLAIVGIKNSKYEELEITAFHTLCLSVLLFLICMVYEIIT